MNSIFTAQKLKFFIKDFFSKCDQIHQSCLRIWSHLLKKSLMENLIFCALPNSFLFKNQSLYIPEVTIISTLRHSNQEYVCLLRWQIFINTRINHNQVNSRVKPLLTPNVLFYVLYCYVAKNIFCTDMLNNTQITFTYHVLFLALNWIYCIFLEIFFSVCYRV